MVYPEKLSELILRLLSMRGDVGTITESYWRAVLLKFIGLLYPQDS